MTTQEQEYKFVLDKTFPNNLRMDNLQYLRGKRDKVNFSFMPVKLQIIKSKAELFEDFIIKKLFNCGIPEKYLRKRLSEYWLYSDKQKKLSIVFKLLDSITHNSNSVNNLNFSGLTGTGKTHLSCALAYELIKIYDNLKKKCTIKYDYFRNIINNIINKINLKDSTQNYIDNLKTYDLLILDEIGRQKKTDFTAELFFEIISQREANNKLTILISNYDTYNYMKYINALDIQLSKDSMSSGFLYGRVFGKDSINLSFDWENYRLENNDLNNLPKLTDLRGDKE